ncbi:hypothetical protein [Maribellus mangrovi]|uniref:hypothetical protein n=1 Tax=Maribellus mangrovi TaxID=3133146 RepID=UPI0030ECB364
MQFEPNHMYHVFNRGNNSQQIFFSKDNYLFFLQKIKKYILPFADVVAWCLMPNHFHLMIYVNNVEIPISEPDLVTPSHLISKPEASPYSPGELPEADLATPSHLVSSTTSKKTRSINQSVAILLRSYTRALQKQEHFTGSLFQHRTKALCLTEIEGPEPTWFPTAFGTEINIVDPEKEYPQVCFNYIHQNPVDAGLVIDSANWEFSSYQDYAGIRKGTLVNKSLAVDLGLHI